MSRPEIRSILVCHATPEDFGDDLERSFPDIAFRYAAEPAAVMPAVEAADPQAVFAIAKLNFVQPTQRPAILHPAVRWLHIGGSGFEHFRPWDATRLTVTNGAGLLAPFLAETVFMGILALNGNLPRYGDQQRGKVWRQISFRPLQGQTLLILGLGVIGGIVAAHARGFGMRVIAVNRRSVSHPAVDDVYALDELPRVIGQADVVSIHLRVAPETRGLVDGKLLRAMRRGAILVNTSRGALVIEDDLVRALAGGHLRGAYLDVFAVEPLSPASPLWTMPNVVITPHAADNVADWPQRYARLFMDNLSRWRDGRPLINEVRP
ncbi:MAG: D-2-hydroxyacid dehydrogenase [Alphaproteobacteria bacterium]|nr:D-2-hydroxyacid dehydrogenase [Alphaproteobacteria bacterium]